MGHALIIVGLIILLVYAYLLWYGSTEAYRGSVTTRWERVLALVFKFRWWRSMKGNATLRESLLTLVAMFVQRDLGMKQALEHDQGDYECADVFRSTGKPVALWSFGADTASEEAYEGQTARIYFHVDEANNRAVVVDRRGFLAGGGYVIDGASQTYEVFWRSCGGGD